MDYLNIEEGIFVKRVNRFIAEVKVNGNLEIVHVKNTGRCKELLVCGSRVYLQKSDNPLRKTKYSIISIYKGNQLINMDSQVPNAVVYESILNGSIDEFTDVCKLNKEKTYKNSRFDLHYIRKDGKEGFIEVKGVTLEENGVAMFPDAPTERGRKHIYEMIDAVKNGYEGNIFFLIQMKDIKEFKANDITDVEFAKALAEAKNEGVKILVYTSIITKNSINIDEKISF